MKNRVPCLTIIWSSQCRHVSKDHFSRNIMINVLLALLLMLAKINTIFAPSSSAVDENVDGGVIIDSVDG